RALSSIDMAPTPKQDILTELQEFFGPETDEWCYENGAPYRKGYMLYGPPGTGKSSLCMAIASEFHLPVHYFHLADMNDSNFHDKFQELPKKCIVLFEEIDTARIVRESTMKAEPEVSTSDRDSDSETESPSGKPRRSQITLGGFLNVIDGPGAKEGRLVIFTTNSPNSLDEAFVRPGRIDRRIFLSRSSKLVASITFSRIFGTDPHLKGKFRKQDIDRMAKQFGELIPNNTFTACEVQQFCMSRRGKPQQATKEVAQWVKDKLSGAQ
ncbi:P-loop containing nucleoside triphosphate hydrolase protein, partial [Bimuria novae-zelandiae CBS 107.79]